MHIKLFVPDIGSSDNTKIYTPLLYPSFHPNFDANQLISKYGTWTTKLKYVQEIAQCDIVTPAFYIDYYIGKGQQSFLDDLYKEAKANNKFVIVYASSDYGVTPQYQNLHLYRLGGYFSRNKGNEFLFPNFFPDPIANHFNGQLSIIEKKTPKPLVGFCGQGSTTPLKVIIDLFRGLKRKIDHKLNRSFWDTEVLGSTTYIRSQLLDKLENSNLVDTAFIRHKKYRAGMKGKKEDKEKSTKLFFNNMVATQYNLCYRGNGNFSVRLYETLACGRIPIIVMSDNNMVFPNIIDWKLFPIIDERSYKKTDRIVADFHNALTDAEFVQLQFSARKIWLDYLSYSGYMNTMMDHYISLKEAGKLVHQH